MYGMRSVLAFAALATACGGTDNPPPSIPTTAPPSSSATAVADADGGINATAVPPSADGAWPFSALNDGDKAALLERVKKDPNGPIKSNWTPPGKGDRYGHAEGLIPAPVDKVRTKLTDYQHYDELAGPKFKSVKVVDKQGASTDVYFQLPIMKGTVTIWYVTRFAQAKSVTGGDVIDGTFVKGNIKGMHLAFTVRPGPDASSSVMVCDLLLQPNVPAPQTALDEELRDACGDAINALKKTVSGP